MQFQAGNAADPLRYAFIVSQAELVDAAQVASTSYNRTTDLENVGSVSVGVSRADGQKCSRQVPVPCIAVYCDRTLASLVYYRVSDCSWGVLLCAGACDGKNGQH